MYCLLEALRVNEISVDYMQWSPSFLGLGWYASVFQGVVLLREAKSAPSLFRISLLTQLFGKTHNRPDPWVDLLLVCIKIEL
jgi:multidrug transporter EmrE-like cation transporter